MDNPRPKPRRPGATPEPKRPLPDPGKPGEPGKPLTPDFGQSVEAGGVD